MAFMKSTENLNDEDSDKDFSVMVRIFIILIIFYVEQIFFEYH